MNNVTLIGRTVRNPEMNRSQNGHAMTRFTLAVTRSRRKTETGEIQEQSDFIGCVAFGQTAELIANYVSKGQRVGVQGRIQTGSYVNKEGATVYTTDVVVNHVEFLEKAQGQNQRQQAQGQPQQQYQQQPQAQQYAQPPQAAPMQQQAAPAPQYQQQPMQQMPVEDPYALAEEDIPF